MEACSEIPARPARPLMPHSLCVRVYIFANVSVCANDGVRASVCVYICVGNVLP